MKIITFQDKVRKFVKDNQLDYSVETHALDLVSEVGEVAKEILRMTNYGRLALEKNEEIKEEVGDAFYSLIVLANKLDISLQQALDLVLKKYYQRLKDKGSAGSEVEK